MYGHIQPTTHEQREKNSNYKRQMIKLQLIIDVIATNKTNGGDLVESVEDEVNNPNHGSALRALVPAHTHHYLRQFGSDLNWQ